MLTIANSDCVDATGYVNWDTIAVTCNPGYGSPSGGYFTIACNGISITNAQWEQVESCTGPLLPTHVTMLGV